MTKDFDLQSPKWLNIIFAGKNQRYGAYQLRNESSNRHIKALIVVIILSLSAIFLPSVIENMIPAEQTVAQDDAITQTDFDTKTEKPKVEEQIIEIPNTPPPVLTKTIMVTEAKIVKDEEVQEQNLAKANEALKDLDAELASKDNLDGVTDGSGVNLDEFNTDITGDATDVDEKKIYTWVQVKPSFPGGEKARIKWLQDNLVYPSQAAEASIQGQVQVGFVVEKDGSISGVKIVKSVHSLLDREAMRLVKSMPKWIPGKQNGNTVRAYYTQPIRFVLR